MISHRLFLIRHLLPALCLLLAPIAAAAAADQKPLLEAPLVDWSVGRSMHQQIASWVKNDKVERDVSARPVLVCGVAGVRVTLRFMGITVAIGDAMVPADTRPESAVDLRDLAARATDAALIGYREERDRVSTKAPAGPDNAKPAAQAKREPLLLEVDLQIAHSPTDILLPESAPAKAIYYQFAAGHHALRMTSTSTPPVVSMIWPSNAIAANLLPPSQINQLLSDAGYTVTDILTIAPKISRDGGPRLQRFEVIHLVRPFDGQPVIQLTRGNELIPHNAIDGRTVDSMGQRLAQHLTHRIILEGPEPGSLVNTYHPTSDRYDPGEASLAETALAAYAMSRRAAMLGKPDPNGLEFMNLREKARVVTSYLRKSLVNTKPDQGDNEARALLLLTLIESPFFAELKVDRDKLGAALMSLPLSKGQFLHPGTGARYAPEVQALIALSLTALYEQTRDPKLAAVIEPLLTTLWSTKYATEDLLPVLPWLTHASIRMHQLQSGQADEQARAFERQRWAARSEAIQSMLELLDKKLVDTRPALGPDDVIGGYDLINETREGAPTPDWRSAYALAFQSYVAVQKELMEDRRMVQLKFNATLTVRFLAQLMIDEPSCYYVRGSRRDALHGVRFALWDNRLAVKPTAMTLLAVTELQEAVARVDRK